MGGRKGKRNTMAGKGKGLVKGRGERGMKRIEGLGVRGRGRSG